MRSRGAVRRWRRQYILLEKAVLLAQQKWRRYIRQRGKAKNAAAAKIQSIIRAYQCHQKLLSASLNAIIIQRCYHQFKVMYYATSMNKKSDYSVELQLSQLKNQAREIEPSTKSSAATAIQSQMRAWKCRNELSERRKQFQHIQHLEANAAAVTIQSMARSSRYQREVSQMKEADLRKTSHAATVVQSQVRLWMCRDELFGRRERIDQTQYLVKTTEAVISILAAAQSSSCQRDPLNVEARGINLGKEATAAIAIQARLRSWK